MYRYLFLLFFLVPLLEVWIMVQVGREIGAWSLILLILLTAAMGVYFLRQQGLSTWLKAQSAMEKGELPAIELVEGALLLVAGAMLLTPGFATDALGFLLVLPSSRRILVALLIKHLGTAISGRAEGRVYTRTSGNSGKRPPSSRSETDQQSTKSGNGETIDGEYTRED